MFWECRSALSSNTITFAKTWESVSRLKWKAMDVLKGAFGKAYHFLQLFCIMLYMVRRVDSSSFYPAVWDKAALHKHAFPFSTYLAWLAERFWWRRWNYTLLVDNKLIALLRIHNTLNFSWGKEIWIIWIFWPNELKAQAWEKYWIYWKGWSKNIEFNNIPSPHPRHSFLRKWENARGYHTTFELPQTWDEYLRINKHSRHELRRKLRKFKRTRRTHYCWITSTAKTLTSSFVLWNLQRVNNSLHHKWRPFFADCHQSFQHRFHCCFTVW